MCAVSKVAGGAGGAWEAGVVVGVDRVTVEVLCGEKNFGARGEACTVAVGARLTEGEE